MMPVKVQFQNTDNRALVRSVKWSVKRETDILALLESESETTGFDFKRVRANEPASQQAV